MHKNAKKKEAGFFMLFKQRPGAIVKCVFMRFASGEWIGAAQLQLKLLGNSGEQRSTHHSQNA